MKGDDMTYNDLIPIKEQLERIEKKLDGEYNDKFLSINQVAKYTSCSPSTIRRAINRGELKCSRRLGKLLFRKSAIDRWLEIK